MNFPYPKRLFPLHLTDIEHFLVADDRRDYPMTFVVQLKFSGRADEEGLRAAIRQAAIRHPLLLSRIGPGKNQALCWLPPDGQFPAVDFAPAGTPVIWPQGGWIDLRSEIGLRASVRTGADETTATFHFHHVCCDGIGAYRFLGDMLGFYALHAAQIGLAPPQDVELPPLEVTHLRSRADRGGGRGLERNDRRVIRDAIRQAYDVIGKGCTPLCKPRRDRSHLPPTYPAFSVSPFSRAQADQLRDAAKNLGLMLNDLLLLELLATCQQWNKLQGLSPSRHRYRVMMPVDLRGTEDFQTPAANVIGYTFITRSDSQLANRTAVAQSIREETAGIKHNRSGERFVEMVAAGRKVPRLLRLLTGLPRTLATVILSNVGDPSRRFLARLPRRGGAVLSGNLLLEQITGHPPIRPRTRATFSITQYRRELILGAYGDPHSMTLNHTQQLLDLYAANLRAHLTEH